jgi:hypothetical protein
MPARRLEQMLGAAVAISRSDARSDSELLTRFLDTGDERAFEVLLVRHCPAVRAVCRTWLRVTADIDDAAQAVRQPARGRLASEATAARVRPSDEDR